MLCEAIGYCDATPLHVQTINLRKFSSEGKLTTEVFDSIVDEEKPNQHPSQFKDERISKLIPNNIPKDREEDCVVQALEFYNRHRERQSPSQER